MSGGWKDFYEIMPDGRFRITAALLAAFEAKNGDRVVIHTSGNRQEKILVLDRPYRVGDRQLSYDAFLLEPISLPKDFRSRPDPFERLKSFAEKWSLKPS